MLNATAVTLGGTAYSAGSLVATYEYDAFGKVLRESGPFAASNPFQCSTKYTDIETGLDYFGYRYYNPNLGRFLGRDPSAERGGLNLYAYCLNNSVNKWDYLGLGDPTENPESNFLFENLDPNPGSIAVSVAVGKTYNANAAVIQQTALIVQAANGVQNIATGSAAVLAGIGAETETFGLATVQSAFIITGGGIALNAGFTQLSNAFKGTIVQVPSSFGDYVTQSGGSETSGAVTDIAITIVTFNRDMTDCCGRKGWEGS
jgi:RHS repeat-associated protein